MIMINNRILLVDDNKGQRVTLESILKTAGFQVVSADCGLAALNAAESNDFAAALLDIKMPDMTGIDVLKSIKGKMPELTVIMMTGYAETDFAIDALNCGATAYLLKPANIEQIKSLLNQAIEHQRLIEENKAMGAALMEWNVNLERKVKERTAQLEEAHQITLSFYEELKKNFESTLEVLSIAIDQRDPLTASHSFRVTEYAIEVGKALKLHNEELEKLRYAGLMHDLGKIEIKEHILRKEGSLTADEYHEIQTHANGTFSLLSKFKFRSGLIDVPAIASGHHERFDGNGYPRGLKGTAIPLGARILAVADVLDAITSKRHYRNAMSIQNALAIIKREAGGHFDPICAEALMKMSLTNFIKIHLVEHLEKLEAADLVVLQPYTLQQLVTFCEISNPNDEALDILKRFHKYYQGPIPTAFEGKISPAPRFDRPTPNPLDKESSSNC
ncbi:MAG: Regulator of RpoS [Elusimicrobia bacterium]|nr:Regulator of RpoS [Elusimicrobiota bacterium]